LSEVKASEKAGPQVLGRSLPPAAAFRAFQDACQPPSRPEEIGSASLEVEGKVEEVVDRPRDDSRS
jgi:hypothetical protein